MDPIPTKQQTEDYIKQTLHDVLSQGLTKLAKEKPKEPVVCKFI